MKDLHHISDRIGELKIIPVAAVENADDGLKLCGALRKGGLPAIEVTFRTSAAAEIIRKASKAYPDMLIGAGTVLNVLDLETAVSAGAKFAVAPRLQPGYDQMRPRSQNPVFPGCLKPQRH